MIVWNEGHVCLGNMGPLGLNNGEGNVVLNVCVGHVECMPELWKLLELNGLVVWCNLDWNGLLELLLNFWERREPVD